MSVRRMEALGEASEDGLLLSGEHAAAYEALRVAALDLERITKNARIDIERAQMTYRDALAAFTRLSTTTED